MYRCVLEFSSPCPELFSRDAPRLCIYQKTFTVLIVSTLNASILSFSYELSTTSWLLQYHGRTPGRQYSPLEDYWVNSLAFVMNIWANYIDPLGFVMGMRWVLCVILVLTSFTNLLLMLRQTTCRRHDLRGGCVPHALRNGSSI